MSEPGEQVTPPEPCNHCNGTGLRADGVACDNCLGTAIDPVNWYDYIVYLVVEHRKLTGVQIRSGKLELFCRWLIGLDEPEGKADRQTLTLTQIIDRARELVGEQS